MFGIKKYDVLKKFKNRRTDLTFVTRESNNSNATTPWSPQDVIVLIHLVSMGFLHIAMEKEGELSFQMTEDGKLWFEAASAQMVQDFGRGAG